MRETFDNGWLAIDKCTDVEVADLIATGTKSMEDFLPNTELINCMKLDSSDEVSILDFGCGMGRNLQAMLDTKWKLVGYDSKEMISRAKKFLKNPNRIDFYMDWNDVKKLKFDWVIASLVFQHIQHKALRNYLQDLQKMTNNLLINGRMFNDHGGNTWDIVFEYFNLNHYIGSKNLDEAFNKATDKEQHDTGIFCPAEK